MERMVSRGRIRPGCKQEYICRHDEIWPEMKEVLRCTGICNYTIFADGDELFGNYECERGVTFAERTQAENPVIGRWNEYMKGIYTKGILELVINPKTGAQPKLEPAFQLH